MLVGGGPLVVDGEDGSVRHVQPVGGWEQAYREQVRGVVPPDPLLDEVRETAGRDGWWPALRHLRRRAPRLTVGEAKAYVDALRAGELPAGDLLVRTRPESHPVTWLVEVLPVG
jgi:hypothetical protein